MNSAFVYIMSNPNRTTFYIGVTNDMRRRAAEHKSREKKGFTAKYNLIDLVYYEWHDRIVDAIAKEKRLKLWHGSGS